MARSLRSGLGKSRVFQKAEYDKIFNSNLLEEGNEKQLDELCFKFIIANGILDAIREQIQQDNAKYLGKLPIFKKVPITWPDICTLLGKQISILYRKI